MRVQRWITIIITVLAAIAVATQFDLSAVIAALSEGIGLSTLMAFSCIVANLGLSFLRFRTTFRIVGLRPPLRQVAKSFLVGHLGSLLIFSPVGQAVGRAAVLASAGVSAATVTFLSLLERVIALGSLLVFALVGAVTTLGGVGIDLEHGGRYLVYMMIALPLVFLVYAFVNRRRFRILFAQLTARLSWTAIAGCFLLSVIAHCAMLGAFYTQFAAYEQPVPVTSALGALAVVMFLAALPISFAGWGIRELSAAHVLGQLGVPVAIGVAVGASIGLLSLLLVGICFAATFFIRIRPQQPLTIGGDDMTLHTAQSDIDRSFVSLTAVLVPFAILFQLRVPLPTHWLNVNLADLLAVSTAAVLLLTWDTSRPVIERARWIVLPLALISGAIAISLAVGYVSHGFLSWAFVNRTLGWFVILSYLSVGLYLWAHSGRARVLETLRFVVAAVTIVAALQIVLFVVNSSVVSLPREAMGKLIEGFLGDRNAFAFQCVIALITYFCLRTYTVPGGGRSHIIALAPIVLSVAVVLTQSRTGWVLLGVSTGVIACLLSGVRREALFSVGVGSLMAGVILIMPSVLRAGGAKVTRLSQGLSRPGSDTERLDSILRGLELWSDAPLLGQGLGGFLHDRLVHGQDALVIHNVPVWILAEMGLVGFGLMAAAFTLFVRGLLRHWDAAGAAIPTCAALICLVAFCLGGLTQDFFYQRMFWFVTGLLIALASAAHGKRKFKHKSRQLISD